MSANTPITQRETARKRTILLVQFAVLLALEALVCFTPLGSIPIGPLVATLSHIPVIFAAVLLGTGAGAGIGFFFGLFSFLVFSFQLPGPISFLFTPLYPVPGTDSGSALSLLICFVPRILIGVTAGLVHTALSKKLPQPIAISAAAVIGTLTNTLLVVGGIYLFFAADLAAVFPAMAQANGFFAFLGAFAGWNGLLELAAALVLAAPVCVAVKRATKKLSA
ncbi:MAG: ECF transporter S component [Oscillospiraceae bacterium]|jgi:uncharacterized membrane protein|nr:ECF transporter S component [Oscillospiraceae bacterium]